MALKTPCDFAKARYVDIGRFRKLWGSLWILLGASVALFLFVSVVLFIRSSWLPGAISALGTIVNGAGMTWITTQRRVAADEEEKAFAELIQQCAPPSAELGFLPDSRIAVMQSEWYQQLEAAKQSGRAARRFLANLRAE